jgi:outer membrane protein OmpA-like peptidoglycan-associated protein
LISASRRQRRRSLPFTSTAFLALLITGCSPVTSRIRTATAAGKYDEAIARGREWLADEGRGATKDKARTADDVAHLVAEAELERARRLEDVEALRSVRAAYSGRPGFEPLVARAVAIGAETELRKDVAPRPTITLLREFRARYPNTPEAARARQLEVKTAGDVATALASPAAERRFRTEYGDWPEAEAPLAASRSREVELAERTIPPTVAGERQFRGEYGGWREAQAAFARSRVREVVVAAAAARGRPDALDAFATEYAAWPEAEQARAAARSEAAALALGEAGDDLERLRAFRARFPEEPWSARGDAAIATALLDPVRRAITAGGVPDDAALRRALAPGVPVAALRAAATDLEPGLWVAAGRGSGPALWILYAELFPETPRAAEAAARGRALAWEAAQRAGTVAGYREVVGRFPGSDEADQSERRAAVLERVDGRGPAAPRAVITGTRALPSGEVELTLDVLRCGERVAGLRRNAFELYVGGRPHAITGFLSLEEERPLQIVFVLDLSGSMAVEREAVRSAIQQFAETFRFRGRKVGLGLVSFSDELRDRRAPTQRPEEFRGWLDAIGDATGGAMEDTVGGLLAASDVLGRAGGERVIVLLTDEPLQRGATRVLAAARRTPACGRVFRLLDEYKACAAPRCRLGAVRKLGPGVATAVDTCVRGIGMSRCDRQVDAGAFGAQIVGCAGGVESEVVTGSPAFRELRAKLAGRGIRPFMVLPHELAAGGPLADLSEALDGRIHAVDDDSSDPATFAAPLLAIADQLSKQYVVRYRPAGPAGAASPRLAVQLDHEWSGWGESARAASLARIGRSPASCPELAALTPGGALHRSRDCGRRFERWTPGGVGTADAIAAAPGGELLVLSGGRVLAVGDDGSTSVTATGLALATGLHLGWDGTPWVTGRDARGAVAIVRRTEAGFTPFRLDGLAAEPLAIFPGGAHGAACALVGPERRVCGDGAGPSQTSSVVRVGVDARLVASGIGEVLALPGRPGAHLWATPDGAVLRTVDSGGHFREALPPGAAPWRLTAVPSPRPLVCAASPRAVRCSEDLGLSWFAVGSDLESASNTVAVGTAGGQVFLDRGERLERLTRVINRDIPSSAVYFETDRDGPRSAITPFLAALGRTLAASSELVLRVEGHADRRGDDAHNDDLARRRAQRVADAVAAAGARPGQLEVASYGSRRPIRTGVAADDLARNRRVELVLMQPMGIDAAPEAEGQRCPDNAAPADAGFVPDAAAPVGEEPRWDAPNEEAAADEEQPEAAPADDDP